VNTFLDLLMFAFWKEPSQFANFENTTMGRLLVHSQRNLVHSSVTRSHKNSLFTDTQSLKKHQIERVP